MMVGMSPGYMLHSWLALALAASSKSLELETTAIVEAYT